MCLKIPYFCNIINLRLLLYNSLYQGPLAEWLGKALQKLLQRFESARDLK